MCVHVHVLNPDFKQNFEMGTPEQKQTTCLPDSEDLILTGVKLNQHQKMSFFFPVPPAFLPKHDLQRWRDGKAGYKLSAF